MEQKRHRGDMVNPEKVPDDQRSTSRGREGGRRQGGQEDAEKVAGPQQEVKGLNPVNLEKVL